MKKQLPTIVLAVIGMVLAWSLYFSKRENVRLKEAAEIAPQPATETVQPADTEQSVSPPPTAETNTAADDDVLAEESPSSGRRMMKNLAKMMDNPTMNKVMEASQRGAIGALYSDLIEYLKLDGDETDYFMDLLMMRQRKQMELGMKMMGGGMSAEEKNQMAQELEEANKLLREEMKNFLNSPDDFDEFSFYEKTMGERMMLSQMDRNLAGTDTELSDQAYRELLGLMHEEKKNFDFSTDLQDEKNADLSPERFSKENLQNFADDMDRLNAGIVEKAGEILTPEQLKAFEESMQTTTEMQKSQLEMAAQMFGGGN